MNILAICSALNKSYIGLEFENEKFSEIIENGENYHSLYIVLKIKELITNNKIDLKKLDFVAVNTGPGSFTGIRVALSIAKVMANELSLPLVPLNSAEILLKAFNKDIMLMDARRDMYILAESNSFELILKDKIKEKAEGKPIVCDKRCKAQFPDALCYEDINVDLGLIMLELAKNKFTQTSDKDKFNPLLIQANYIQTPPVFA